MNFGVPKELPPFKQTPEYRVGLSPMGVQELMLYGVKVYVETKAGEGAGFSDADYEKAGATIVFSKEEAYRRADVVLKVRRPQQEEYSYIKEGQTIMGFIHLITAKKEFLDIVKKKKITLVGYEIMQTENGRLPVVIPMSEMAGNLAVQIVGYYLVAGLCIPLGYGHLRTRRWIRPLSLAALGFWIVLGVPLTVIFLAILYDKLEGSDHAGTGEVNLRRAARFDLQHLADLNLTACLVGIVSKTTPDFTDPFQFACFLLSKG